MKLHDLNRITLTEAPIGDLHHIGNWEKNSSFGTVDRKLVTNPILVNRMRERFGKCPYDFQIFFVNSPEARKYAEIGEVDATWLHDSMPKAAAEIDKLTQQGVGIKEDSINIIFTNNTGAERVPMTTWIMAHRIGHALRRKNGGSSEQSGAGYASREAEKYLIEGTRDLLTHDYGVQDRTKVGRETYRPLGNREAELLYTSFWQAIGTFKSARDGNLRDYFEMLNELIAQYITTGAINFKPLPPSFEYGRAAWGRRNSYRLKPDAEGDTNSLANTMEYAIGDILSNAVGRIYVM